MSRDLFISGVAYINDDNQTIEKNDIVTLMIKEITTNQINGLPILNNHDPPKVGVVLKSGISQNSVNIKARIDRKYSHLITNEGYNFLSIAYKAQINKITGELIGKPIHEISIVKKPRVPNCTLEITINNSDENFNLKEFSLVADITSTMADTKPEVQTGGNTSAESTPNITPTINTTPNVEKEPSNLGKEPSKTELETKILPTKESEPKVSTRVPFSSDKDEDVMEDIINLTDDDKNKILFEVRKSTKKTTPPTNSTSQAPPKDNLKDKSELDPEIKKLSTENKTIATKMEELQKQLLAEKERNERNEKEQGLLKRKMEEFEMSNKKSKQEAAKQSFESLKSNFFGNSGYKEVPIQEIVVENSAEKSSDFIRQLRQDNYNFEENIAMDNIHNLLHLAGRKSGIDTRDWLEKKK